MSLFNLQAPFEPGGDQPDAIAQLTVYGTKAEPLRAVADYIVTRDR